MGWRKKLFHWINKESQEVMDLKINVSCLNEEVRELKSQLANHKPSPVYIVEQLNVEKYEVHNSFGAIGIKNLSGRLNIGANYENDLPDNIGELLDWKDEELSKVKNRKETQRNMQVHQPKVNVQSKDAGT